MNTCSTKGWSTNGPQNRAATWAPQHAVTASAQAMGVASVGVPTETGPGESAAASSAGTRKKTPNSATR
jgi:hypothetical protein